MNPIYLDYNATTPVLPAVAKSMQPYLEIHFGNPSSSHWFGRQTRTAIEKARGQVAGLLGCTPGEIVFTSGGSESNNYAIKGAAMALRSKGNHIITSAIEHPAVTEVCRYLERNGFTLSVIPVDVDGMIDLVELKTAIRPETILITVMHANNEVGTIQPLAEIAQIAKRSNILFHSDAAQSTGKIPTRVSDLGVDLLSVAGHKLYAPKGIGALYIRQGIELEKLIHGAGHEQNRRAGTENILEIAGLGAACELATNGMEKNMAHLRHMRDRLHEGLIKALEGITGIRLNGSRESRLPNTLSVGIESVLAQDVLVRIQDKVAISAGSACHADGVSISETLAAMRVPEKFARGTLRLSTGKPTTAEEVDSAIEIISMAVRQIITEAG